MRFIAPLLVLCAGCSSDPKAMFDAGDPQMERLDAQPSGNLGDGGVSNDDGGGVNVFYANDDHTLYQLDPNSLTRDSMKRVGDFDCIPSLASVMTDIAVSKDGKLFGVSPTAAWPLSIQTITLDAGAPPSDGGAADASAEGGATDGGALDAGAVTQTIVHCDAKWPLPYSTHFNGLSFAPENTIAKGEVLVGGNALGELYAIDSNNGNPTIVGKLGTAPNNLPWGVSGDIVFMANKGNPIGFVTGRTCTSNTTCDQVDTLLEIDMKQLKLGNATSVLKAVRGPIKRGASCASQQPQYGAIFGIVALGAKVYGFSRWGDFITIDNDTGAGCLDWSAPGINFAGAGITTTAPVVAPPPR